MIQSRATSQVSVFRGVYLLPTGWEVKLIYDGHNRYDFHAVDLWTRPTVPGDGKKKLEREVT